MPKGTKVHRCVIDLMAKGHSKASAIRICQKSTGQSYATGERSEAMSRAVERRKLKR